MATIPYNVTQRENSGSAPLSSLYVRKTRLPSLPSHQGIEDSESGPGLGCVCVTDSWGACFEMLGTGFLENDYCGRQVGDGGVEKDIGLLEGESKLCFLVGI